MKVSGTWSTADATSFLESTTVPVRLACHSGSDRLWMLSLWYRFHEGRLECATSAGADIVGKLRRNEQVAFEVSTNRPPYKGVRGNGTATIEPDPDMALLRTLIERYLGDTQNQLAQSLLDPSREEVRIIIDPARIYTWDFTERMGDASD